MRHTEFWDCIDSAFPEGLGRSLAEDLVLPDFGNLTAVQALEAHVEPQAVWSAICREMDLPPKFEYLHRISVKDR